MTLHVHHIGRSTIQTTEPDRAKAIAAAAAVVASNHRPAGALK